MKIVKIGALWCPGCLVMKRVWKNIQEDYELDILDLDLDMNTNEVSPYNPGNILPVTIFLDDNGNELSRLIGEQKESTLREYIEKYR